MKGLSHAIGRIEEFLNASRDNFDRNVSNPLVDLIDVPGERDFTPERLRYFKDGSRVFLQYGTDPTFDETERGYLLQPGSGQTLTMRSAEKAAYQVGFDLWPTMSRQINGPLQTGDVVGGGYGRLDLQSFDPGAVAYGTENPASGAYSGTDADGYFWYHTATTGTGEALLAMVQNGTVLDSRVVELVKGVDVFTIMEQQLNWYAVGPCVFRETSTDITQHPERPQINRTVGAVANDDGAGPAEGSQRITTGVHQASGNSGLEFEVGSKGIRAPGSAEPQFKVKGHSMDLDAENTTLGTYEGVAAIRIDPSRETVKLRFDDIQIISTPGNSTNSARVLIQSVDPANTNADDLTFEAPVEHSEQNSVLREVEDNTITAPVEDDPGTDSTGAVTANELQDPGGYQVARASITPEGSGSSTSTQVTEGVGNRELYPGDIAVILLDTNTAGLHEIDIITEQNS